MCPSSILKAKERALHPSFFIAESFPTCLITHTICSQPKETIQPVCGEFLKHSCRESRQDEQDLILTKDDGTFSKRNHKGKYRQKALNEDCPQYLTQCLSLWVFVNLLVNLQHLQVLSPKIDRFWDRGFFKNVF